MDTAFSKFRSDTSLSIDSFGLQENDEAIEHGKEKSCFHERPFPRIQQSKLREYFKRSTYQYKFGSLK